MMKKFTKYLLLALSTSLLLSSNILFAEEQIYGQQLMTEQERNEHRIKMQSMNTPEERERYRLEHHSKMEQRAKEQGITLPEMPLQRFNSMDSMDRMDRMERGTGSRQGAGGGGHGR